jgi:hypothetical protein
MKWRLGEGSVYLMVTLCMAGIFCLHLEVQQNVMLHTMGRDVQKLLKYIWHMKLKPFIFHSHHSGSLRPIFECALLLLIEEIKWTLIHVHLPIRQTYWYSFVNRYLAWISVTHMWINTGQVSILLGYWAVTLVKKIQYPWTWTFPTLEYQTTTLPQSVMPKSPSDTVPYSTRADPWPAQQKPSSSQVLDS